MKTFKIFLSEQYLIEDAEFKQLKKNKIPLTDEERKEVFKKDAVWHNSGLSINPVNGKKEQKQSAIWKSKNPKTGKITFVSHTHRAYNTSSTLDGIIKKYHDFIKTTA